MHVEKKRESRRVEGARRTTARPMDESPVEAASPQSAGIVPPDPEVVARPTRRRFTAEDTLRILQWADACTAVGSRGELRRAEGLYASNLTTWRRQRTEGGALGVDAPETRPKSLGPASPAGRA